MMRMMMMVVMIIVPEGVFYDDCMLCWCNAKLKKKKNKHGLRIVKHHPRESTPKIALTLEFRRLTRI